MQTRARGSILSWLALVVALLLAAAVLLTDPHPAAQIGQQARIALSGK